MKNLARRNFFKYAAAALGSFSAIAATNNKINAAEAEDKVIKASKKNYLDMSPDEAISELMAGNKRFVAQRSINPNQSKLRLKETAESQSPFAAILTCADSRVSPEIVFDRGLGDLFVVRDAGNIATSEEIGSLEYGVSVLNAKVIIVMGHQNCGAVQAAMKLGSTSGFIASIVNEILPAVEMAKQQNGELIYNAITANVLLQKQKITTSPVISQLVAENKVKVIGAYYDLGTGKVDLLNDSLS